MEIFISWSGERSLAVAKSLRNWLPKVIQVLRPWISAQDIDKGSRWLIELSEKLKDTNFGIICLTSENLNEPWLLFEAGALSKAIETTFVCPILLDIEPSEVKGPLSQFQLTKYQKNEMLALLQTINNVLENGRIADDFLYETFQLWWPKLESEIGKISICDSQSTSRRDDHDILEELLQIVRSISRQLPLKTIKWAVSDVTSRLLATLTPREEKILRMIYGIGEPKKSIEDIAELLNISTGDIEKSHDKALRKIRHPSRIKILLSSTKSDEF